MSLDENKDIYGFLGVEDNRCDTPLNCLTFQQVASRRRVFEETTLCSGGGLHHERFSDDTLIRVLNVEIGEYNGSTMSGGASVPTVLGNPAR